MKKVVALSLLIALILINYGQGQSTKPSATDSTALSRNTFVEIAKRVGPAVVNVYNKSAGGIWDTTYTRGLGTGFIIDSKNGIILTNNHVIRDAKTLAIALSDKRIFDVKLIGSDPIIDVAVLKIENPPANLREVTLGDSDKVSPGEWIVAIGQPFGYEYTVTAGIVCGLGREVPIGKEQRETIEYRGTYIQIDAMINPGNSGGPLFNLNGEVIGINTVAFSGQGGIGGSYGGSIPINTAKEIKDKIMKDGRVIRAYLGLVGGDIDESLAGFYNQTVEALIKQVGLKEPKGIFIRSAADNSPAASAGFKEGDVLIEFDGKKVDDLKGFRVIISKLKPNAEVKLKYMREGKEVMATVTLSEMGGSNAPEKEHKEDEDE